MADDLQDPGPQDRTRINVDEPRDVAYWTNRFGVTSGQLRNAVIGVGDGTEAVEQALKSRRDKV